VSKVQHYKELNTDLDNLYNTIKQLLEGQKDLQIVSEYKGLLNAVHEKVEHYIFNCIHYKHKHELCRLGVNN
jgi:hypothetical protein